MSDSPSPPRVHRRSSANRFADEHANPDGLYLRRSRSGNANNSDPFAVATGINNSVARTMSAQRATLAVPPEGVHHPEEDITAYRSSSEYSQPSVHENGNRFNSARPERTSDATLRGDAPAIEDYRNSIASKKHFSSGDFSSQGGGGPSIAGLPSLAYGTNTGMKQPGANEKFYEQRNGNNGDGFFGHIKQSVAQLTNDTHKPTANKLTPTRSFSTSSSLSSDDSYPDKDDKLDNFNRSQAINDKVEDTYLIDEAPQRPRQPYEIPGPGFNRSAWIPGDPRGDGHKSYRDRRRKGRHVIKYHVESPEDYQKFILIFAKALIAFGSPSHRIEAQLNSLAKVFELEAQFQHTPGIIQVSFGNPEQKSSETCLIKSGVSLALGRIHSTHNVYRSVLHDDMYASDGIYQLRKLLNGPPQYGSKTRYVLSFITCLLICGVAFGGSLNDMWVAGVMGVLVRVMQNIASKSDLSASGSEVFAAALVSFIARGFASFRTQIWCFSAISSAGVVSLLPGYLILSGSLDIAGKNQLLGGPKIVSGIMTSLYLGFGLTLGSDLFLFLDRPARRAARAAAARLASSTMIQGYYQAYNSTSSGFGNTGNATFTGYFTFTNSSAPAPPNIVQGCFRDKNWGWYLQPMPYWSLFFLVPLFAFGSSMNNQQHWFSRQMVVMVSIACVSFWITRLCNITLGLGNHPDYVSLIGSWLVGILGNGYSRRFGGTAFTTMLTGILLLVPDGLSAAGGLAQQNQGTGQDEYTQSLTLARKMISVIIGILAGVYSSAAIIYLFGKKKNAALVTF